jgi:hypothetical protein
MTLLRFDLIPLFKWPPIRKGLQLVLPEQVPAFGTFWWVVPGGAALPTPCPPPDLSGAIYQIADGQFLVDETGGQVVVKQRRLGLQAQVTSSIVASAAVSQADALVNLITQVQTASESQEIQTLSLAMGLDVPMPGDGSGDGTGTNSSDATGYTVPDYGSNLWLEPTNVSNGRVNGLIHNSAPLVPYTLFSMQSLPWPAWNTEATFYGSGTTNSTVFSLPVLERGKLFFRARSLVAPRIIGAGASHNVAIQRNGTVWTWGENFSGQLGNGQWNYTNTPVQVTGLPNIVAVTAPPDGYFTLALDSAGRVWSWGEGDSGQLGRGDGLYANTKPCRPGTGREQHRGNRRWHGALDCLEKRWHGLGLGL